MNAVTQQNIANAEESSSTAAEMSGQSAELATMIGGFQLASQEVSTDCSASLAPIESWARAVV